MTRYQMKTPTKQQLDKITNTIMDIIKYTASEDTQKTLIINELIHLVFILQPTGDASENQKPS